MAIRIIEDKVITEQEFDAVHYLELACLHDDSKPTDGIVTGSLCIEVDTGKVFLFNEASETWVEQFSLQS